MLAGPGSSTLSGHPEHGSVAEQSPGCPTPSPGRPLARKCPRRPQSSTFASRRPGLDRDCAGGPGPGVAGAGARLWENGAMMDKQLMQYVAVILIAVMLLAVFIGFL